MNTLLVQANRPRKRVFVSVRYRVASGPSPHHTSLIGRFWPLELLSHKCGRLHRLEHDNFTRQRVYIHPFLGLAQRNGGLWVTNGNERTNAPSKIMFRGKYWAPHMKRFYIGAQKNLRNFCCIHPCPSVGRDPIGSLHRKKMEHLPLSCTYLPTLLRLGRARRPLLLRCTQLHGFFVSPMLQPKPHDLIVTDSTMIALRNSDFL